MENKSPTTIIQERKEVSNSLNIFSFELYSQLIQDESNVFCSPFSTAISLAMLCSGAAGHTQRDLFNLLRLSVSPKVIHDVLCKLFNELNGLYDIKSNQLIIANAFWGQLGLKYSPAFIELLRHEYHSVFKQLDFEQNPMVASSAINHWVYEITKGEISHIIRPDSLTASTRLLLTNADFFKGKWEKQFSRAKTVLLPFRSKGWLFSINKTDVTMMHQTNRFRYTEDLDMQVLELPYQGNELSMVVFLPKKVGGLPDFEQFLTYDNLVRWIHELEDRQVEVFMPRFSFSTHIRLGVDLQLLGLNNAFDPRKADFSGIVKETRIALSEVVHKAFVQVDEEGTEALATTSMKALENPPERKTQSPRIFKADHPFFFIIRYIQSDTILFMGRIVQADVLDQEL
ncbi:serpin family protein [bacterium]|nr:serpin family protein [bacterium]